MQFSFQIEIIYYQEQNYSALRQCYNSNAGKYFDQNFENKIPSCLLLNFIKIAINKKQNIDCDGFET